MPTLKDDSLGGFNNPTALPENAEQARQWQKSNQAWWENNPMRYDWMDKLGVQEFTEEFYREIDRRFFEDSVVYMPPREIPFDHLIDFASLRTKDVLEIGVGCGSHAGLLAQHARSYTGIDLTNYAVRCTSERMRCFGFDAAIGQMDAEHMAFADDSFDFIWSWGVIHHSSDTRQILSEMHRVLRPGGHIITMVYFRNNWNWYVLGGLRGVFQGGFPRAKSLHTVTQRWTDGALARYYTIPEWKTLTSEFFQVEEIQVFGSKSEIVFLPAGRLKAAMLELTPDSLSRFLTNRCKMGLFLVSTLKKEA